MRITYNAIAAFSQILVNAIILFLLYRVILNTLGAEQLGVWSVVLATASSSRIGEFGLSASVTRFVAKYKASGEDKAVGYIIQTSMISSAIFITIFIFIAYPVINIVFPKIFPEKLLSIATELLPYTFASLILTVIAGTIQSVLDGYQHYVWRALLSIFSQLIFVVSALILMPNFGLTGLAFAQIIQSIILIMAGWILIHRLVKLPYFPYQWKKVYFREIFNYGIQVQVGTIVMMLFEPFTKILLGKFGGFAVAGYYEMASQAIGKVRLLIVSANQVIIPVAAELNNQDKRNLHILYHKNLHLLFLINIPLYAFVIAWSPLLSEFWIGHYQFEFIFFLIILALAWGFNTFDLPAYFINMGVGEIIPNTVSHIIMGLTNAGCGMLLGHYYGTYGIALGLAIAIITGSLYVIIKFHHDNRISTKDIFLSKSSVLYVVAGTLTSISGLLIYKITALDNSFIRLPLCVFIPFTVFITTTWHHPSHTFFKAKILNYFK